MLAHAHTLHHGHELETAAQLALENAGEQWTSLRANIFKILAENDKPASAYDIADQLSRRDDRRVAANSVYRILDLFVATNLAKRIESANAYIVNAHPGCVHDCIFLLCDSCGAVRHVDEDSLSFQVRKTAHEHGFSNFRPIIEVRGICDACASISAGAA